MHPHATKRAWAVAGVFTIGAVTGFSASANGQAQPNNSSGSLLPGTSLTCQFNYGPRSGQTLDLSHTPGGKPDLIGAPCTDGQSSFGVTVSPGA